MIKLPENWDSQLKNIYESVPGFSCEAGCGKCCVSPHITFLEFLYFTIESESQLGFLERKKLMTKEMDFHDSYEGNLNCRYQHEDQSCSVHPYRPLPSLPKQVFLPEEDFFLRGLRNFLNFQCSIL